MPNAQNSTPTTMRLQFRGEVCYLLNLSNFQTAGGTRTDAGFDTVRSPRNLQFTLNLY